MKTIVAPIIGLISLLTVFLISISAQETTSREKFLSVTESALDALDKLETIFSDPDSTRIEARLAQHELETALKKYERYAPKTKTEGEMVLFIKMANFEYMGMSMTGKIDEDTFKSAKENTQKARDIFKKCIARKNKK
jgi:hypothetical protein